MHDAGFPHYILVHAILGVQSAHPHWKAFLTEAWDVAKQWKLAEPPRLRPPLPRALLRAMVGLALAWDWSAMAALLLLGFTMFLRPGEMLVARRCDLSLPSDRPERGGDAFLSILAPKLVALILRSTLAARIGLRSVFWKRCLGIWVPPIRSLPSVRAASVLVGTICFRP